MLRRGFTYIRDIYECLNLHARASEPSYWSPARLRIGGSLSIRDQVNLTAEEGRCLSICYKDLLRLVRPFTGCAIPRKFGWRNPPRASSSFRPVLTMTGTLTPGFFQSGKISTTGMPAKAKRDSGTRPAGSQSPEVRTPHHGRAPPGATRASAQVYRSVAMPGPGGPGVVWVLIPYDPSPPCSVEVAFRLMFRPCPGFPDPSKSVHSGTVGIRSKVNTLAQSSQGTRRRVVSVSYRHVGASRR